MRLSGEVVEFSVYPPENEIALHDLLTGKRDAIPWEYYTHQLNTKEIVIPFK